MSIPPVGSPGTGTNNIPDGPLSTGRVTVSDWLDTVGTARTELFYQTYAAQTSSAFQDLFFALGKNASDLGALQDSISSAVTSWQNLFTSISLANSSISSYQSQAQSAISTLNSAIATYNGTFPPTAGSINAYNNAVSAYNSTMAGLNSTFAAQTSFYNSLAVNAPELNSQLASLSIPLLSPVPQAVSGINFNSPPYAAPSAPNYPLANIPNAPNLTITQIATPPSIASALQQYLPGAERAIVVPILAALSQVQLQNVIDSFSSSVPGSQDATLPAAYIKRKLLSLGFNVTSKGSGTGVGAVSVGQGLAGPLFLRVVSNAIRASAVEQEMLQLPTISSQLQIFALDVLSDVARIAGQSIAASTSASNTGTSAPASPIPTPPTPASASAPAGSTVPSTTPPVAQDITNALTFSRTIRNLITSNTIGQSVAQFLNQNPALASLTAAQKSDLAAQVTAALNLAFLQIALTQIAFAAKLPGLVAQILGNVRSFPPFAELFAPTDANQISKVIGNPLSLAALQESLITSLKLKANLTLSDASVTIAKVISTLQQKATFSSEEDLRTTIKKSLQDAGINADIVDKLAEEAVQFVRTENALPNLNAAFNPQPLQSVLTAVARATPSTPITSVIGANPALATEFPIGSPVRNALEELITSSRTNPVVQQALTSSLATPFESNREFRETLINKLAAAGIENTQAQHIASLAIKALAPQLPVNASPLQQPVPLQTPETTQALPLPLLGEEISKLLVGPLTSAVGESRARETALKVINEASNLLNDYNVQILQARQDQRDDLVRYLENNANALQPSLPLTALNITIGQLIQNMVSSWMDPTAQQTLTGSKQASLPMNIRRGIDIQI